MDEGVSSADSAAAAENTPSEDFTTFSFRIIALAGEAHSFAMQSIKAARAGDFPEAASLLEHAEKDFSDSHDIQTEGLTAQARGVQLPVDILLVHAQDHLTMANMAIENARVFIDLYQKLATATDHPHPMEE